MDKAELGEGTQQQFCTECGSEYEAHLLYVCGKTHDMSKGWCRVCRSTAQKVYEKKEEANRQLKNSETRLAWRRECGIPPLFMNKEFGNLDTKRPGNIKSVFNSCLNYAQDFPIDYASFLKSRGKAYPSMVMYSVIAGLGKTHLAASICHNILNRWQDDCKTNPVRFITEAELLGNIQETYNFTQEEKQYRESEELIIRRLIYGCPLLVLDEVGYERRSDLRFVRRVLFRIINGRYNRLMPMVVTTNLNPDQLRRYLDAANTRDSDEAERSYDRLYEMCGGHPLKITGESYRRLK